MKENLVYAVECGADVTLHTNFPNSYRSIMRVLHDSKVVPKSVMDKPQVQGYLLELGGESGEAWATFPNIDAVIRPARWSYQSNE